MTRKHIPPPPIGPPNQWVVQGDPYAFDIVTGDVKIDRAIARRRGLYPPTFFQRMRRIWNAGTPSGVVR